MAVKGRQLQLTPLAELDLEDMWRYTAEHGSLAQADHYHRDLSQRWKHWRTEKRSAGLALFARAISGTR